MKIRKNWLRDKRILAFLVLLFILFLKFTQSYYKFSLQFDKPYTYVMIPLWIVYWTVIILGTVLYYEELKNCLTYSFLKKLLIVYATYYLSYISVSLSLNINNDSYLSNLYTLLLIPIDIKNIYFSTIIVIFCIYIILHYLQKKHLIDRFDNKLDSFSSLKLWHLSSDSLLLIVMISSFMGSPLLLMSFRKSSFFRGEDNSIIVLFLVYLGVYCVISVCSVFLMNFFKSIKKNTFNIQVAFIISVLLSFIYNFAVQLSFREDINVLGMSQFPGALGFQVSLLTALFLFFFLIFNRFLLPFLLINFSMVVFVISNTIKYKLRREPILYSDLYWLQDIKQLLSFVDISYLYYLFLLIGVLGVVYAIFRKKILPNKLLLSYKYRLCALLIVLLYPLTIYALLWGRDSEGRIPKNIPILSSLVNIDQLRYEGNVLKAQMKSLSFLWLDQMTSESMVKPRDYSKERMEDIYHTYQDVARTINENRTEMITDQTIISVLSESFSDLNRIEGIELSQDVIPNIREIMSETTSGLMKSDGYGGGTANMEFQELTGLPKYNMNPTVSAIYTEVVPKMSYIPSMSQLYSSKDRYAIHFSNAYNYSRNVVYKKLDFNRFISISDSETFNVQNVGVYPSDQSTYDAALTVLNDNPQDNLFLSVMTMQNHSPWSIEEPNDITAKHEQLTSSQNYSLNSYAKLMWYSDNATKSFLDQLSQMDRKVTVVFYGDHLPGFYPNELFQNNPDSQYETDFFIWSNYDEGIIKEHYSLINSSDFYAALLKHTNSKVSPYSALLTKVLENSSVNQTEPSEESRIYSDDLKLVEYDLISGEGYLSKKLDFFEEYDG